MIGALINPTIKKNIIPHRKNHFQNILTTAVDDDDVDDDGLLECFIAVAVIGSSCFCCCIGWFNDDVLVLVLVLEDDNTGRWLRLRMCIMLAVVKISLVSINLDWNFIYTCCWWSNIYKEIPFALLAIVTVLYYCCRCWHNWRRYWTVALLWMDWPNDKSPTNRISCTTGYVLNKYFTLTFNI